MKLTFYGASGEVTGSNYVIESDGNPTKSSGDHKTHKVMVDCGLHQGSHYAERLNFEPFPYDPRDIDAVFVSHAHLDHSGRLPKLIKNGFQGTIYSTPATKDFAELILLDSEHILAKEAEREGKPPLYTVEDIGRLMSVWKKIDYHVPFAVGNFNIEFFDAGHILGSAIIKIRAEGKSVVFSGDLGNFPPPIIKSTEMLTQADYCVLESTYGDRIHENVDKRKEMLEDAIEDAAREKGTLIIPTFAMERAQELLYHMHQLFSEGRVPRMPVFIDSPLAIKLTAVYKKYENSFNKETLAIARSGDDILNFPGLRLTLTTEQSKEINDVPPPKIIMAGSGMSQGGRILHHEIRYLPDPKSTILIVGYQAAGSLGRQILDGAAEVKIFGEKVPVRCKVKTIPGYSAHADQPRLLEWVGAMRASLKKVFVTHGEQVSAEVLAQKIRDELAVRAVVPKVGETDEL
jgi:metallo-beta-lactamase family protein